MKKFYRNVKGTCMLCEDVAKKFSFLRQKCMEMSYNGYRNQKRKGEFDMTDNDILNMYLPLVDFLSKALGSSTEVVLNDCSKPACSVVAISNSQSGRKPGSPITDYGMNVIRNGEYKNKDYDLHYKGKAYGKDFISSTFYIKDPSGRLIGMLCLNTDMTGAENLISSAKKFFEEMHFGSLLSGMSKSQPAMENLDTSLTTLIDPLISRAMEKYDQDPAHMTQEEKVAIVHELSSQGVSSIKGGISAIASALQISESTVYRYLKRKE